MIRITIHECKTNGRCWTSQHRTDDARQAMTLAIAKFWGKRASFWRDNGISQGAGDPSRGTEYGQIGEPIKGNPGCNNMITGRISVRAW